MDERVFERMVSRSFSTICDIRIFVVSSVGLFLASLCWLFFQPFIYPITNSFHIGMLFLAMTCSTVFIAPLISPLIRWSVAKRTGEKPNSIFDLCKSQYKHMIVLGGQAFVVTLVQGVLLLLIVVWYGLEGIPAFGSLLYILGSWVPMVLGGVMGVLLIVHVTALLTARVRLVYQENVDLSTVWKVWPKEILHDWALRIKLLLLALLPFGLFFLAAICWPLAYVDSAIDAISLVFRAAAFSVIASPFLMFAIHISVEADRYVQWLSSHRVG